MDGLAGRVIVAGLPKGLDRQDDCLIDPLYKSRLLLARTNSLKWNLRTEAQDSEGIVVS